jgi:hypothetical protein
MPNRGQIVQYTYAELVDQQQPDGTWIGVVGYTTLPAVVLQENSATNVDLHVFGELWRFPNNDPVIRGVVQGSAPPDTKRGSNANPTAVPGQPGTWSP